MAWRNRKTWYLWSLVRADDDTNEETNKNVPLAFWSSSSSSRSSSRSSSKSISSSNSLSDSDSISCSSCFSVHSLNSFKSKNSSSTAVGLPWRVGLWKEMVNDWDMSQAMLVWWLPTFHQTLQGPEHRLTLLLLPLRQCRDHLQHPFHQGLAQSHLLRLHHHPCHSLPCHLIHP